MQITQSRTCQIVVAFSLLGMVAGCRSGAEKQPDAAKAPTNASKSEDTKMASANEKEEDSSASADIGGKYRVRIVAGGRSNVAFTMMLNGQDVGTFNSSATNDVSAQVRPGKNDIDVKWTNDREMPTYSSATLFVESQRPDSTEWNTVFSREVRKDTAGTEAKGAFTAGSSEGIAPMTASSDSPGPGAMQSPPPDASSTFNGNNLTTSPEPSPSVSASDTSAPASAGNGLTEKYSVKVTTNTMAPGEFTLVLNGEEIGSFNTNANQDITALLKPGKNVGIIRYAASKEISNQFADSTMTVGVQRDGKWSTVANQAIRKDSPKGEKKFTFMAK